MADTENQQSGGRLGISKGGKAKTGKKAPLGPRVSNNDGDQTVEQRYQKKTQLEHILLRPDTYIGSTDKMSQEMWVYDEPSDSIVKRMVTFVPGLYKIFDEIIVNAADNKQRDSSMSKLKVTVDAEKGSISVWNDGQGIPIQMHKEHHVYVPELIFGNLLTGSNFDDDQKKTTGGRNGFGAKLANIYSTEFVVETADGNAGKHYRQVFRNNMQDKEEPVIDDDYEGPDFTCITFSPDWKRFHMTGMEADTIALLRKRVYDMAGCMGGYGGARMKVYLDKKRLQVASFKDYMSMFAGMETPVVFEKINDRWEVGVAMSADSVFQQVSYVNAICTVKGGTHVECVANQVIAKLLPVLKRKHKAEVKGHLVKNHLCVFVNGLVENPAFNSQSKEALTSKDSAFGSVPKISDAALKTLEKSEIVERVLSWAKHKQNQQLNKKSGKKSSKLTGITKLDDANHAGTARSQDCTLILTEGDSAKTLAVSGLGVVGRDRYGVFPLKGKLLNVREATAPQVLKNEEIQNVVKILGLKFNHDYQDTKSLRYGHLMIMTDQDHDGSHIKGLLINFVHHYWPSLLKIDGFLQEFITPIVKVSKGRNERSFYTVPEYNTWKDGHSNGKGWNAKYYKGLGTSTAKEAKEYFAALDTHQLEFEWKDDLKDADLIDMAFSKKRVEDRKDWLRGFKAGTHADYNVESVTYESFINKELILFSMEDNKRSIPCLVDGFKPSQRKVLFSCFKRNLKKEIKVVQLAGYVSEHSAYHHGEASLNGTITAMAQNYTGSNNLNLLTPGGQFGTRLMGGKDAASPRYIFTSLQKAARAVFHPDDDALLTYLDDDGLSIEPEFYVPVLPLILVNGSDGIGTGWSSQDFIGKTCRKNLTVNQLSPHEAARAAKVPNYCPRDVIENLKRRMDGKSFVEMQPWYHGFAGSIEAKPAKKGVEGGYLCKGIVTRIDDTTVEITELAVRKWTQDYKQFLESLLTGAEDARAKAPGAKAPAKGGASKSAKTDKDKAPTRHIKDFKENHTDTTVHFTVTMTMEDLDAIDRGDGLYKFFKLESTLNTTNMVLFDQDGQLIKYDSPQHIMEEFFTLRMEFYHRRKASLLSKMQGEWSKLDNKVRFILAVVEGRLKVNNRKKAELLTELKTEGYDIFLPPTAKARVAGGEEAGDEAEGDDDGDQLSKGYDYLLGMKLWSLTLEKVRQLENELEAKTEAMGLLKATEPSQLWVNDLDAIGVILDEIAEIEQKQDVEDAKQRKNAGKGKGGGRGKGKASRDDGDSDFEDAPKKKASKSKAKVLPPPPPPSRAIVPELVEAASGGMVSAAFAEAESSGKLFNIVPVKADAEDSDEMEGDGEQDIFGHADAKSKEVNGKDDDKDSDEDEMPTKKMASMSLAARVRMKFGDKSSAPPAAKAKPAPRKPSARAVVDSDDSDVDSEDSDVQDEVIVAKPRPSRNAAKKKQPIVEVDSGEDEMDEDHDDEASDKFDSAAEDEESDDYAPTPVMSKAKPAAGGKAASKAAKPAPTAAAKRSKAAKGKAPAVKHSVTSLLTESEVEEEEDVVVAKAPAPKVAAKSKVASKVSKADDSDDDIFNMGGMPDDEPPAAKGRGKGKAPAKRGGKATVAKGKAKVAAKANTPPKAKGLKRGSRMSISDEDEVFSPDKMSPPTKRVSQKATPAASRLRATAIGGSDSDSSSDSDVEEVTKTPRPTRRGGRAVKKVVYADIESEESEESEEEADDDESDFEG